MELVFLRKYFDILYWLQQSIAKNLRKIPNLRFNQLTKKVEVDGKAIESNDLDLLYIDIQEKGWDIGKIAARDAFVRQAKKDQYHPIR